MAAAKSLTQAELAHTLKFIARRRHAARDRAMLLCGVLAGLRAGEIAGLTIGDVLNPGNGEIRREIHLPAHRVKYGHARTIYVSTRLQKELGTYVKSRKWHSSEQPLFYTQHKPRGGFSADTLSQHMCGLFRAAGIVGASSHSGRKTFLTSLASQGISVFVLAALAGHKNIATTQRYITVNEDLKRRAVELV